MKKSGLPINLEDLIHQRTIENERIEYKAAWNQAAKDSITRTICAFANDFLNTNGGYIIIGMEAEKGKPDLPPRGLQDQDPDHMQNDIIGTCKGNIIPEYLPSIFIETFQGKEIMILWCPAGETRPYQAPLRRGEGKAYWIRPAGSTIQAKGDLLNRLFEQTGKTPYDDRRSLTGKIEDISPVLVNKFLTEIRSSIPNLQIPIEEIYENLRLTVRLNDHKAPRNAALLFFNHDPEKFFRSAHIDVVQFVDDAGGDLIEEREFRGPLHEQVRSCLNYLKGISGVLLQKKPDQAEVERFYPYPYGAMEEAVVNAIFHRSYQYPPEPIKVYIYPNRMTITSYPGPMPGILQKHFQQGKIPMVPLRNRRIGEFLKELRMAEARGTGIPKILHKMKENGSPPPIFEFDDHRTYFSVTLPIHPFYQTLREFKINGFSQNGPIDLSTRGYRYSLIYNGAKHYRELITGVGGRFKYLHISDQILAKVSYTGERGKKKPGKITHNHLITALPAIWNYEYKHVLLVGEAGMGKTTSLLRFFDEYTRFKEYKAGLPVPVYIRLSDFDAWQETANNRRFILEVINRYYLHSSLSEKELYELMCTPLTNGKKGTPSIILLLDGINEITGDKRNLLLELKDIMESCPAIQVVITSRYDIRPSYNWGQFHLLELSELDDAQVRNYLGEQKIEPPRLDEKRDRLQNEPINRMLRNPMMLTMYASTCEVVKIHQGDKRFRFKEPVKNAGELMWNFIEAQTAKWFDHTSLTEAKKWYYKFLLNIMLPAVGFEMAKQGRFKLEREELYAIFEKYWLRFSREDFFLAFPGYEKYEDTLPVGECANDKEKRKRRTDILHTITEVLSMMVGEGGSFLFLHRDYRDFFAAVHLSNEAHISLSKGKKPTGLNEQAMDYPVRRMMEEIASITGAVKA